MNPRHAPVRKWPERCAVLSAGLLLSACGGGGNSGPSPDASAPVADTCSSTAVPEDGNCRTFGRRIDTRATTPFVENGQAVTLEVVLFKPLADARYPTLVFHHGSTGDGSDPTLFDRTFTSKAVAAYFVDRGWMVAFPQRRGRGRSDGLYDEGFTPDRSAYSCALATAVAGADRALDDIDAATGWLRNRSDVDSSRMLIAGTSRGGILSIAYLARRQDVYLGAMNFVGGWLGEGCGDFREVNRTLFVRGATIPAMSAWLYAENDSFYSVTHSRRNFDAFSNAGGLGSFDVFTRAAGLNGHFLLNDPSLWSAAVDAYLSQL